MSTTVAQHSTGLWKYADSTGKEMTVTSAASWEIKRKQVLENMQMAMGVLPDRTKLPPMRIEYLDSVVQNGYTRYTIRFTAAANERIAAYLYIPAKRNNSKNMPAMLALHPTGDLGKKITDGQAGVQNRAYAREMAERGYVVIAPDYPGFGDLKDYNFDTDRYQSGTMKSIFDNMRCVDLLQSLPEVDPNRIGVIGHSLGGHSAIFTGAFDSRLKVVVSSCGWTLFGDYFNGDTAASKKQGGVLWPWAQDRYMPLIRERYHLNPNELPFDFDEIIATIAPRAFFSNSPVNDANFNVQGVRKGIASIGKLYTLLGVPGNLQVRYPDSGHDFPTLVRWEAYYFIDSVLQFTSRPIKPYFYLNNAHYLKRMQLFAGQKEQKNIVMLGNSLTERAQWNTILERDDVANRGIGSDITEGYIARITEVFDLKPQTCFVEGGVNDLAQQVPQDIIIKNLEILVDTLRSRQITPVLHTLTYVSDGYKSLNPQEFNSSIKNLNKAIKSLAKQKKVQLIDLNAKTRSGKYLSKKYAVEDGIHYTPAAYLLWKKEITKTLNDK